MDAKADCRARSRTDAPPRTLDEGGVGVQMITPRQNSCLLFDGERRDRRLSVCALRGCTTAAGGSWCRIGASRCVAAGKENATVPGVLEEAGVPPAADIPDARFVGRAAVGRRERNQNALVGPVSRSIPIAQRSLKCGFLRVRLSVRRSLIRGGRPPVSGG